MEIQQIKHAEIEQWNHKSKYNWLCTKKVTLVILSLKQEYKIRQALTKVDVEDQIEILRKLMKWLSDNPLFKVERIPEITLDLINNTIRTNLVNQSNLSRINSFRNSLRRLSILSNRIAPEEKPKCVTFKDTATVYKISK
ncbi:uncharacterized protein LOC130448585 isoform X2 [Diorhabda sublineata]|nr:uncharacterized protein LOC130448585 isoform X2 [Diorhabda sublineata]